MSRGISPAELRAGGLHVTEITGWQDRHHGSTADFKPEFFIFHHTAGTKSLGIVTNGRPDLDGPLCDFHVPKSGMINFVSDGVAWHAGSGSSKVLVRVRADLAPLGDASALRLTDDTNGNTRSYGAECENLGTGSDPWPEEQLNAMALLGALVCRKHGWTANRCVGHREWTARKPDPRGFPMTELRARIRWLLGNTGPTPAPAPVIEVPAPQTHYWTDEDGTNLLTQRIEITLDDKGRGNVPTGIAMEKFVALNAEAGVRPNVDGWYPGDPMRPAPRCWPQQDNGQIIIVVRDGLPPWPIAVWLTTRA